MASASRYDRGKDPRAESKVCCTREARRVSELFAGYQQRAGNGNGLVEVPSQLSRARVTKRRPPQIHSVGIVGADARQARKIVLACIDDVFFLVVIPGQTSRRRLLVSVRSSVRPSEQRKGRGNVRYKCAEWINRYVPRSVAVPASRYHAR